eukprot:503225_1
MNCLLPAGETVLGVAAKLLLDAQELVVLGSALATAGGTGLDLTAAQGDDEISDVGVLGLTRAVRDHDGPALGLAQLGGLDSLGDGADLVDLEEQRVAALLLDGGLDALSVGDGQVITHHLGLALEGGGEAGPCLPVVLVEGVLDGDDGVVVGPLDVDLLEALGVDEGGVLVLEGQVVLLGVLGPHLTGGAVHADGEHTLVAGGLDGLHQQGEGLVDVLDRGSEATLVTHVDGVLAVLLLQDVLEAVVDLAAHAHGLTEGGGLDGGDHELLEGQGVTGVLATVDDVEAGHGEAELSVASELGQVLVQGEGGVDGGGLADGHGEAEHGVGAELALVLGAVEVLHQTVKAGLVADVLADQGRSEDVDDVADGLGDTLAEVAVLVTVTELAGLVDAGGGTTGDAGAEGAVAGGDLDLDGGVATGVQDLAGVNLEDDAHAGCFEFT